MSELLASVKRSFYHDVLGCREAEARLEGREGAYLFRESDVKSGLFIISYVKNSSVSHLVTPNRHGKFIRQTLEEAVEIAADVIASDSDSYHHPVPPSPGDESSQSSGGDSRSEDSRCYCCSFTTNNKRSLEGHQKTHKIVKCQKCRKYFKSSTFSRHKKHCNITAEKISCGMCDQ